MIRFYLRVAMAAGLSLLCFTSAIAGVLPAVKGSQVQSAHRPLPEWAKGQSQAGTIKSRLARALHLNNSHVARGNKTDELADAKPADVATQNANAKSQQATLNEAQGTK